MPDRRIVKANAHALALLRDLNELTLATVDLPVRQLWQDEFASLLNADSATDCYLIGFEDHLPIGYVLYHPLDQVAELRGPFLFPEYRETDAGEFLIERARRLAQSNNLFVLITLVPRSLTWCGIAYDSASFDEISSDTEFIRRWNDGLLADYLLTGSERLMGCLLDPVPADQAASASE